MVIDYRAVNKLTTNNHSPLPVLLTCLTKVQGSQYITSLGAACGFHESCYMSLTGPRLPLGRLAATATSRSFPLGLMICKTPFRQS